MNNESVEHPSTSNYKGELQLNATMKKTIELEQHQHSTLLRLLLEAIHNISTSTTVEYNRISHWRTIFQAWVSDFQNLEGNIKYPKVITTWKNLTERCLVEIDMCFLNWGDSSRFGAISIPNSDRLRGCALRHLMAIQKFEETE